MLGGGLFDIIKKYRYKTAVITARGKQPSGPAFSPFISYLWGSQPEKTRHDLRKNSPGSGPMSFGQWGVCGVAAQHRGRIAGLVDSREATLRENLKAEPARCMLGLSKNLKARAMCQV